MTGDTIKRSALQEIAGGMAPVPTGRAKVRIGNSVVHYRYCATNSSSPEKYKFNINTNTLSADYELWICGESGLYYLIPMDVIREIYENSETYQDYHHPGIKIVSVDTIRHSVMFASGGQSKKLAEYLGMRLK